jgi:hypothetical protein
VKGDEEKCDEPSGGILLFAGVDLLVVTFRF